jgi:hypothetical protein
MSTRGGGSGGYEADEAILRVEAPRLRRDLVKPATPVSRRGLAIDDEPSTLSVELTPEGAVIHIDRDI